MRKKVRLRLHVEADLLGTRITPSPRKRDPKLAKKPGGAAWMTADQRELWGMMFFGVPTDGLYNDREQTERAKSPYCWPLVHSPHHLATLEDVVSHCRVGVIAATVSWDDDDGPAPWVPGEVRVDGDMVEIIAFKKDAN